MKHTIQYPEGLFEDGELRTIIWEDEAGTVEGDHSDVPRLQRICESDDPYLMAYPPQGYIFLDDVAHNPQHFISALIHPQTAISPRAVLPDSLKGIEPLLPDLGDCLDFDDEPLPPGASD